MSITGLSLAALAVLAGALISFQAPINAVAGARLGHPLGGALLSFIVGTIALVLVALLTVRDEIDFGSSLSLAPLLYTGGLLGAAYVAGSIWLTPVIGAGALISLGIAGQVIASLALDHYGMLGLAVRELTVGRMTGAALVLAGALMVRYF